MLNTNKLLAVTPKDQAECNQLASFVHSKKLPKVTPQDGVFKPGVEAAVALNPRFPGYTVALEPLARDHNERDGRLCVLTVQDLTGDY